MNDSYLCCEVLVELVLADRSAQVFAEIIQFISDYAISVINFLWYESFNFFDFSFLTEFFIDINHHFVDLLKIIQLKMKNE